MVVERGGLGLGDSIGRAGEGTGGEVGKAWGARGGEGVGDALGEVEGNLGFLGQNSMLKPCLSLTKQQAQSQGCLSHQSPA